MEARAAGWLCAVVFGFPILEARAAGWLCTVVSARPSLEARAAGWLCAIASGCTVGSGQPWRAAVRRVAAAPSAAAAGVELQREHHGGEGSERVGPPRLCRARLPAQQQHAAQRGRRQAGRQADAHAAHVGKGGGHCGSHLRWNAQLCVAAA